MQNSKVDNGGGGIKRGPWTPEEDEVLAEFVRREGEGRWRTLPRRAGLRRCGKSCRLRWMNYLRPSIRRGPISAPEEDLILRLHRLLGNRWSLIAGRIPGRTDNEIKNYWNTHLSKKLISQGIDPRTHKPLSENTYIINNNNNNNNNNFHNHNYNHDVTYKLDHSVPTTTTRSMSPLPYNKLNSSPVLGLLGEPSGAVAMQDEHSNFLNGMVNMNLEVEIARPDHHQWRNTDQGLDGFGDEVFSSFLDSLISDDSFLQPQQQSVNTEDNIAGVSASRELGFEGALWDAPSNLQ